MAHAEVKRSNEAQKKFILELTGRQLALISASLYAMTPPDEDCFAAFKPIMETLNAARAPVIHASYKSVRAGGKFNFGTLAAITVVEVPAEDSPEDTVVLTMTRAQAETVRDDVYCAPVYEALKEAGIQ